MVDTYIKMLTHTVCFRLGECEQAGLKQTITRDLRRREIVLGSIKHSRSVGLSKVYLHS